MDRLTSKDIVAGVEIFDLKVGIPEEKAFNLLGQYENTGLTPAEVMELVQARADGRIVVLPCEVGDIVKVDVRSWGNVYGFKTTEFGTYLIGKIVSITITKKQTLIKIQAQHNVAWKRERKRYPISAIGKTVFLTKPEAQAALDRMEGQK